MVQIAATGASPPLLMRRGVASTVPQLHHSSLDQSVAQFQIRIGNELVERPVRRLCMTMIRVRFGSKFLSTKFFAKPKVNFMELAGLQILGSICC